MSNSKKPSQKHSNIEDIFSIIQASLVFSIGIIIYKESNIVAGGTYGLALIASYLTPFKLGIALLLINIPFYFIALARLGKVFFIKTILTILLCSAFIDYLGLFINFQIENRLVGSIVAGTLCGMGILALLRHNSSVGGFTILVAYVQEKSNISGGKIMLLLDTLLILISLYFFDFETVIYSIIAMSCVNSILILNHKPGRYSGK